MEDSLFKLLSYTNFTWSTLEYLDPDSVISSMELPLECFHKGLTREKPNKVNFLKYISCFTKSWKKMHKFSIFVNKILFTKINFNAERWEIKKKYELLILMKMSSTVEIIVSLFCTVFKKKLTFEMLFNIYFFSIIKVHVKFELMFPLTWCDLDA